MSILRSNVKSIRMFSSAVLSQALLSAGSLLVGLILIRRTTDQQYGYYVLITSALLLLTILQSAYVQPSMLKRLIGAERDERANVIGGLYREQRLWLLALALICVFTICMLWYLQAVTSSLALVFVAGLAAALATLYREYFRMVLLIYRLPAQVLRVDTLYVFLVCCGVMFATTTTAPAITAALTLACSATVGAVLLSRIMWRHESWNIEGSPGILRDIAPLGTWAVTGAAIHWTFTQGYSYLVAATLDVSAVATLAATRLLLMPVNLMSAGIGTMMFASVSRWLHEHPVKDVLRRLVFVASGIAGLALLYFCVMWLLRDWIFTEIFSKQFEQRDTLLILWSAVFLLMTIRDQLIYLPAARGCFRSLAWLTLLTALFSLSVSYVCMMRFGIVGALIGILAGEIINIVGVARLSLQEVRRAALEQSTSIAKENEP